LNSSKGIGGSSEPLPKGQKAKKLLGSLAESGGNKRNHHCWPYKKGKDNNLKEAALRR